MKDVVWAVSTTAAILIGVLFFLHWHRSRDRFFLYFAGAFGVLGASTAVLLSRGESESRPLAYIIRLLAFLLIIGAIAKKNRERADAGARIAPEGPEYDRLEDPDV